ncbi:MAG: hypothetical protein CVU39_02105 [Chloroflexi bacterium HGW-Chloroflexi-10]|nr:MAG: hypothetical protein CVU39_02105 [Chloroflexi bacterium HGW-Chloroflexi-10]
MKPKKNLTTGKSVWRKIYFAVGIFAVLLVTLVLLNGGLLSNLNLVFATLAVLFLICCLFILFFSQFTLPVRKLSHRILIASRLFSYLTGDHGPAMFIENGELRERKDERLRQGPGVILLDTASAAVIRTPAKFKGAVGPGVAFTERNDSIAGVVDLHVQFQRIGPRLEEKPFQPKGENESDAAYEARQERRNNSKAYTRDGIEVCAHISVVFQLDTVPGEGNTEFGYNPTAVERAIIGRNVDLDKPEDNPERITSWTWLPAHLAADVWREYLEKVTLSELFPLSKNETNKLEVVSKQIKQRLSQPNFIILDEYGNETSESEFSKEYDLLKKRGIKIIAVTLIHLFFSEEVEEQLLKRWTTSWLDFSQKDKKNVEQMQTVEMIRGQNQALLDYAYGATHYLGAIPLHQNLSNTEILSALIKGNLYHIQQDPNLASYLKDEYSAISDLMEWITLQKGSA